MYKIHEMKKMLTALFTVFLFNSCDVLQQLPVSGGVTEAEAGQGIKQALDKGLNRAVSQLNSTDGFFKNELYKILLPPEAKKIENTFRTLGLGSLVDKAVLSINRGAEDAAGKALPIFTDAIKAMTLQDALGIVRGGDTSITHYFREKTTNKLYTAFMPVIQSSLDKVSATRYYGDLIQQYNDFPTTIKKLNPDLADYVTSRTTDAMFKVIAVEEKNIRENPVARTTEILKKVFGGI